MRMSCEEGFEKVNGFNSWTLVLEKIIGEKRKNNLELFLIVV